MLLREFLIEVKGISDALLPADHSQLFINNDFGLYAAIQICLEDEDLDVPVTEVNAKPIIDTIRDFMRLHNKFPYTTPNYNKKLINSLSDYFKKIDLISDLKPTLESSHTNRFFSEPHRDRHCFREIPDISQYKRR